MGSSQPSIRFVLPWLWLRTVDCMTATTDILIEKWSNYRCEGTNAEQSIAIFAPTACGIYGFGDDIAMTEAGKAGSGSLILRSDGSSVKLYAGTTALVQQTEAH